MRVHAQKLSDTKAMWRYGRAWFGRLGKEARTLRCEWNVPAGHCGWSLSIGGGDSGRDVGMVFAIPWLLTLYVTLENALAKPIVKWTVDQGETREIGCYFYAWAFWWHVWVDRSGSWQRGASWCRWYRQGSFHFAKLLGPQSYERSVLQDGIPVTIQMPEGSYVGKASVHRQRWKRLLWFATVREYTEIEVDGGIPFAGKGENSWDCGDDGLWSASVSGVSVDAAVANFKASVLKSRHRYGMPSAEALARAKA